MALLFLYRRPLPTALSSGGGDVARLLTLMAGAGISTSGVSSSSASSSLALPGPSGGSMTIPSSSGGNSSSEISLKFPFDSVPDACSKVHGFGCSNVLCATSRSEALRNCSGAHLHNLSPMTIQTMFVGVIISPSRLDSVPSTVAGPNHAPRCNPSFLLPLTFPPKRHANTMSPGTNILSRRCLARAALCSLPRMSSSCQIERALICSNIFLANASCASLEIFTRSSASS